jgi:hypothetical protein
VRRPAPPAQGPAQAARTSRSPASDAAGPARAQRLRALGLARGGNAATARFAPLLPARVPLGPACGRPWRPGARSPPTLPAPPSPPPRATFDGSDLGRPPPAQLARPRHRHRHRRHRRPRVLIARAPPQAQPGAAAPSPAADPEPGARSPEPGTRSRWNRGRREVGGARGTMPAPEGRPPAGSRSRSRSRPGWQLVRVPAPPRTAPGRGPSRLRGPRGPGRSGGPGSPATMAGAPGPAPSFAPSLSPPRTWVRGVQPVPQLPPHPLAPFPPSCHPTLPGVSARRRFRTSGCNLGPPRSVPGPGRWPLARVATAPLGAPQLSHARREAPGG